MLSSTPVVLNISFYFANQGTCRFNLMPYLINSVSSNTTKLAVNVINVQYANHVFNAIKRNHKILLTFNIKQFKAMLPRKKFSKLCAHL